MRKTRIHIKNRPFAPDCQSSIASVVKKLLIGARAKLITVCRADGLKECGMIQAGRCYKSVTFVEKAGENMNIKISLPALGCTFTVI